MGSGARRLAGATVLLVSAAGCHRHAATLRTPAASAAASAFTPVPIGRPLVGSTVALARVDGHRIAFVSDDDARVLRRFDLDAHGELAPLDIGGVPGPVLVLDDGRIATVLRDGSKLMTLAGFSGRNDSGTDRAWLDVPREPVGLSLSPDRTTTYVTSGFGHALAAVRTADLERIFELDLPREPRTAVVSDDGKRVFVAHAVGSHLSVVDVAKGHVVPRVVPLRGTDVRSVEPAVARDGAKAPRRRTDLPTCQSFALAKSAATGAAGAAGVSPGRVFIPEVMVDPGESTKPTAGYGADGAPQTEVPTVAIVDTATGTPIPGTMRRQDQDDRGREPCLLPRAAIVDEGSRTLLVACQGIDAVIAYDATSPVPGRAELTRWSVGAGPTGIAVDVDARQAVVWSQFDHVLSVITLDPSPDSRGAKPVERIAAMPRSPVFDIGVATGAIDLGRRLFHRTGDGRISADGRACASCHPDGRDDGLVWSTPDGPRRTIMLAGRLADTAPFSWKGNAPTVQKHLGHTLKRLGGSGLENAELEALVGYLKSLPAREHAGSDDDPSVAAGARIFASARAGCSGCHSGPSLTDGAMHDVGSGRTFNTPSLVNVGAAGPWFHDGRFSTLQDLLVLSDGKMGHTKHLKPTELAQLEAFLRSQ